MIHFITNEVITFNHIIEALVGDDVKDDTYVCNQQNVFSVPTMTKRLLRLDLLIQKLVHESFLNKK